MVKHTGSLSYHSSKHDDSAGRPDEAVTDQSKEGIAYAAAAIALRIYLVRCRNWLPL